MSFKFSTEGVARASARRKWWVIGVWVVGLVLALFLARQFLDDALTNSQDFTNKPESIRAFDLLEERGLRGDGDGEESEPQEIVIVQSETLTVQDPAFQAMVEKITAELVALGPDRADDVTNFYLTGAPTLVSRDGGTTLIPFNPGRDFGDTLETVLANGEGSGFTVVVTGDATFNYEFEQIAADDLEVEYTIGIPAAIIILIFVFGALLAAVVPVVLAVACIFIGIGVTAVIGQAWPFSFFVTNMITMMGLAVGVDYSLFVMSRFREERKKGAAKLDAIALAGGTAGRAVFFSGLTVVLALLGMFIVPLSVFRSLGAGAIIVVIISVLASMTLLPAILGVMGDKVNSLRIPLPRRKAAAESSSAGGFWDWMTRRVMAQPVLSLIIVVGILVAAAVPAFTINTGQNGVSSFPDEMQSKRGFEILTREFTFGIATTPASIVVDGDIDSQGVQDGIARLEGLLAADGLFTFEQVLVNEARDLAEIRAQVNGDPNADTVVQAVRKLRSDYVPQAFADSGAEVLVTGLTAANIDYFDTTTDYMPIVFIFVLSLSFILLTVVFRSLVVPIKAILMNLLSVGASYGLLVLVFQHGFLADFLGFTTVDVVEAWIPLFLFSVLFGLSMDYHVFLLSRIRENYDRTKNNTDSVAEGLRSTAGMITGAALIMVAVFSAFAAGELVMFQQFGFGLAVAVFLDATIIRSVLVPASMKLLGSANWYLPKMLNWLPEVRVESREEQVLQPQSD